MKLHSAEPILFKPDPFPGFSPQPCDRVLPGAFQQILFSLTVPYSAHEAADCFLLILLVAQAPHK
eukprot:1891915-Amphidinium_carterae.1